MDLFLKDIRRDKDITFQTDHKHGKAMKIIIHLLQEDYNTFRLGGDYFYNILDWITTISTPIGLFHISLMFGPLMIENGVG